MYEEIVYSKETNDNIIEKYHSTGILDIDTLITNNIPFVKRFSYAFRNSIVFDSALDIEDIIQVGCIGLIKAAHGFSPEKGCSFCTYAGTKIKGEILMWFRDNSSGGLHISRDIKYLYNTIREKMIINPNITDNELAAELHTTVDSIITAKICCSPITYLQNTVYDNDNNSITFEDLLADNDEFESVINNVYLYEALNKLDDKAKNIIKLRYFNDMTQSDISNVLGVSQVQVSRLEKKAINKLRELLKN